MRRLMLLVLAMIAAVVLSGALASAATFTETQTDSIPPTDINWATPPAPPDPLTFDQFDATKGTLTQVKITFDSALTGSMAAENLSESLPCDLTLDWGADVTLDTTDGVLTSMLGQTEGPIPLSIFDGTLDFGGTSGVTFGNLSHTDSQQKIITGAGLAPFIGGGTITLDADAGFTSAAVVDCPTAVGQFITQAAVDVEVEYTFEAHPAIDIEKATNGQDADNPTGPIIPVGDPVNWTYVVTNTGNVPLSNVVVTDNVLGVIPGPDSGDTNNNGILDTTETWTYSASGTAQLGQYANVGTFTGVPPVGPPVTDEDPSHYFGEVLDSDGDGVLDDDDRCADTVLPDEPEVGLKKNRFLATTAGFVSTDGVVQYTLAEAGGCSASQIIAAVGLGEGHTNFGISNGVMNAWTRGCEEQPDGSDLCWRGRTIFR